MAIRKLFVFLLVVLLPAIAFGQDVQSVTVLIDSLTTLPIGTGLVAASADHFVIVAQGERQLFPDFPLQDLGYGPSGLVRLLRGGQLQADRPYGSLLGIFNPVSDYYFYLGDGGAMSAQPDDEGWELQLQLNISASDHAMSGGTFAVTVIRVPASFPSSSASFAVTSSTPLPINTGFVASAGDRFLIRARGGSKVPAVSGTLSDGWFDASGLARLDRFGQLVPEVPYGSLLGEFSGAGFFNIGDGGEWSTQPVDYGSPLLLHLNMSAADQASMLGRFIVTVDRFPALATGMSGPDAASASTFEVAPSVPNPLRAATTIAYRTGAAGHVLGRIYDESGRWVRTITDEPMPAGEHRIAWDATDDSGSPVGAGVYFYQLSFENRSQTGKLTVVR